MPADGRRSPERRGMHRAGRSWFRFLGCFGEVSEGLEAGKDGVFLHALFVLFSVFTRF
jgi:hypothetical protein